ncbi:hypothetical protein RFI_21553, partial [Reticulomyxa filosa]
MLLISTFDEMQNIFQRTWNCKRVEDYAKVSHFEQDVKQFFTESDSDKFIVRYQHKNSEDLTQFSQIKWILETAHASYYKDNNKNNEEKYKDEQKDSNRQKSKKLVVFIVRNVHKLQNPTVFVDSLTNHSQFSLQDFLQNNPLTMIDDPSSTSALKKNLQPALYYLKFRSFRNVLSKIKHGFDDSTVSESVHNMMKERLKQVVDGMTVGDTFHNIFKKKNLYKKLLPYKNGQQCSFVQYYKHVVDSLAIRGWIEVLLVLCENCYLEAALDSLKKSILLSIFVSSGKNKQFVPISHHEYIPDKDLHFFKVKMLYKAQFPFSWNFHTWFAKQNQGDHSPWSESDNWIHERVSNLEKVMNSSGEPFSLLNKCEERECAMYTKDVIRGMFHRYISVQENDDAPDIVKNIVFLISKIIFEKDCPKISIPLIEVILYQMKDVIESYLQLLSLCDNQEIRSSVKQLSTPVNSPLIQLIQVTLKLSNYFLWHPSQMNDIDDIPAKICLACDASQIIANFLHKRCLKIKEYQEFSSVYRQLQMKNLGLKYFWTIDCYSTSPKENLVAVNTLMLAKPEFAKKDILIQIIDPIIGSQSLSVSLMRKIIFFIRDLLYIAQQVEHLNDQMAKPMFQNIIEHVLGRINKLFKDYSTNMLKLQALELLLVKVKEVDPTFIEKHDFKIISNQSPFEKIEAISKLKVQLMKC